MWGGSITQYTTGLPSSGYAFSGGGAYAQNQVTNSVTAYITGSDVAASGDVTIDATSDTTIKAEILAISGAVGFGGTTGAAASIGAAD